MLRLHKPTNHKRCNNVKGVPQMLKFVLTDDHKQTAGWNNDLPGKTNRSSSKREAHFHNNERILLRF